MMYIKKWKIFNESQFSMDFSGKLSPEILSKLKEKEEIAKKAIEKWGVENYGSTLEKIKGIINGDIPFSWKSHINVQGDETKNHYDIFNHSNAISIAEKISEIISKYKGEEVTPSSMGAPGGWSGTMKSTIGGSITPVINYTHRGGSYGFDRNILIGVQVGSGVDKKIYDKIMQECYEILYPMDQYNSTDGGVSIFISSGTNWGMIGLSNSKYIFGNLLKDKLEKIIRN